MPGVRIDRCYCFGRTFRELERVAAAMGAETLSELQQHVVFGRQCQLCHPYVRRMLHTRETVFSEVIEEVDEPGGS